ncbi:MarR family transcriptional regulator [Sorangium cellulosum]|uniref:MarR family transcriptional regulator n=1 Tax=Sorangium cellulosum TaxID=56 RepID=A0A150SXJ5_SORCE|nr:MarR family transcriptional regulator [Sorangium cellulosum]
MEVPAVPGDRLTQEDRRRIAAWLTEGLTYTEMARRLNRPKSTITREVARNGGPEDYRADHAHQLTRLRARRRKPMPLPATPATAAAYGRDPKAVFAFEQRLVDLMIATGCPRMVARILSCLFTTDSGDLTSAELVRRLHVSPAAVSTATRWAEGQGLIVRERGARGKQRYTLERKVGHRSILASVRSNELLAELSRQGAGILGRTTPAGARLDKAGTFLHLISQDLADSVERRVREVFGA